MNRVDVGLILGLNLVLLCGCTNKAPGTPNPSLSELQKQEKILDQSIAELKRLYETAPSQRARRTVGLRAIDEGTIKQGRPVAVVDAIFGTHFASRLPVGQGGVETDYIRFGKQISPPPGDSGKAMAFGYLGWFMQIKYDEKGIIQSYHLNNLWKGHRNVDDEAIKGRTPIAELRRQYETAQSEVERRAVCIQAIDEDAVSTYMPVTAVDALFGTHLASQMPTRKEAIRTGIVEFAPSTQTAVPDKARTSHGWFLAVEYEHDGNIRDYYLTNVRQ
jgi:NAD(P)H-hydrate repair Nnr-like enzyme with NAD(P)H-hydrate epimerase domain